MTTERSGMSLDETPLGGRWHHGNGYLVCGSFRIAKADWEADVCSADNMRERVFDWICETLNAEQTKDNHLSRDAVVSDEDVATAWDAFHEYVDDRDTSMRAALSSFAARHAAVPDGYVSIPLSKFSLIRQVLHRSAPIPEVSRTFPNSVKDHNEIYAFAEALERQAMLAQRDGG